MASRAYSRILCACMAPANRDRDFAAGLRWRGSSGRRKSAWENVPLQGLGAKSHADYFGVALARYIAEKLAIYDFEIGRLLEMKNVFVVTTA